MDPEGFLIVGGHRIFYRSEGEPTRGTLVGRRLHQVIHRKIERSKLVIMKGVSHHSMRDARDAYVKHVAGFLNSL